MNAFRFPLAILAAVMISALPAMAQKKPVSPRQELKAEIDGATLTISYGRPYMKDPKSGEMRKIWGTLVPFGKVWRTGANEATAFTTDKPLTFGATTIPAGSYTLWTNPAVDGTAKLIFNKQTGQWGTKYDEAQDLASVPMKKKTLDQSVEQFTMKLEKSSMGGGEIEMSWELTEYSAEFKVGN